MILQVGRELHCFFSVSWGLGAQTGCRFCLDLASFFGLNGNRLFKASCCTSRSTFNMLNGSLIIIFLNLNSDWSILDQPLLQNASKFLRCVSELQLQIVSTMKGFNYRWYPAWSQLKNPPACHHVFLPQVPLFFLRPFRFPFTLDHIILTKGLQGGRNNALVIFGKSLNLAYGFVLFYSPTQSRVPFHDPRPLTNPRPLWFPKKDNTLEDQHGT